MKTARRGAIRAIRMGAAALALGMTAAVPAAAAVKAGEVHQSIGRVMAATPAGRIRALRRGSEIFSGDILTTGPNSFLRIKYTDGGYMLLRPNTRFMIERYADTREPATESGFFRLLKGGLRAVTGLIGKVRRRNYRLATPVATIGIRGTDFSTRICSGDCLDVDPAPADGLYVGLSHNEGVVIFNAFGEVELRLPGTYGFTPAANQPPRPVSPRFAAPLTRDPIPSADPLQCPG